MSVSTGRALRMAYMVAGLGGIGFFLMSVVLLGYWPGRVLEDQTRRMSPGMPLGLSVSEQRGRDVVVPAQHLDRTRGCGPGSLVTPSSP